MIYNNRQLNDSLDLITTFPNLRGIFDDALFGGLGTGQALKETGKADLLLLLLHLIVVMN